MVSSRLLRCAVFILAVFFGPEWLSAVQAQGNTWETYRSQKFGYSLVFPSDIVQPRSESTDGRGIEFTSDDGLVKLKVLADYNDQNVSLGEYRAAIVREFTESNQLEYEPMGRSWFVLSGVRGESIYYQKVLFACGGRIINAFALTYPAQLRREFDAIVTMIEKNFHPTAGTACAVKIG
jgi:hypothetical protein